ncbi:sugar 3,4-ketoisomerase [Chondromyces crocatus]|uniref:WxcM domain-containing protein n=1 Tax=Chondromyces crocatus TaxID=52 RepID=A0A0K1EIK7_CHOCO|nr:FdtA/QdtA family cupin domain-containing protein [Chondromyces crocatus]AKT40696.1 WxcM domain-containing protein [Chondromyces crocatus]
MPLGAFRFLDVPSHRDPRGLLGFVEGSRDIPFAIRRVYYICQVPPGTERGGHAHRRLEQLFIPLAGSFRMRLDDGETQHDLLLDSPTRALHLSPILWRELYDFSPGAACLILASEPYDEAEYIRDHETFLAATRASR